MTFRPGAVWRDTDGWPIQAHGGGVLYDNGRYFWFGENKDGPTTHGRLDVVGVSCYSSPDLETWTNEGVVLPAVPKDPAHDLHPNRVVERPKVLKCGRTGKYVLWAHIDTADYKYARVGVAVSDTPTGPYQYRGSFRPGGHESRDMTVFQDRDGAAYAFFSSDMNATLRIARLSDDYLGVTDTVAEAFVGQSREAPAIFRHGDTYFAVTSGCTGWAPNEAEYAVAPAPLGPWEGRGNPCIGPDAARTFGAQSAFVLPVADKPGAFILMLDRWDPQNLGASRYVWLPLRIEGTTLTVEWRDAWDLSVFDKEGVRP